MARPQLGKSLTQVEASGIDIMLVLDVSQSMLTKDFSVGGDQATRIEAIREVTRQFIEARPNDRIGIIAFAGHPYVVSPMTLDHDWLLQNLERVRTGMVEDGTAIGSAMASAANRLNDKHSKSRVIVLLTDGENNAGKDSADHCGRGGQSAARFASMPSAPASTGLLPLLSLIRGPGNRLPTCPGNIMYQNQQVQFNEAGLKEVAQDRGWPILSRDRYEIARSRFFATSTSWKKRPWR